MILRKRFILGDLKSNSYVIEHQRKLFIIDAGENAEKIIDFVNTISLPLTYIFITHTHYDHIAGLNALHEAFPDVPIVVNKKEQPFLKDPEENLSTLDGKEFIYDGPVYDYSEIDLKQYGIEMIPIGGHSLESACIYFPRHNVLFSGDVLFRHNIGRSDLPHGNEQELIKKIHEDLLTLPADTKIYPGHGFPSTVAEERIDNPKLKDFF